jgi:hypothetical protein
MERVVVTLFSHSTQVCLLNDALGFASSSKLSQAHTVVLNSNLHCGIGLSPASLPFSALNTSSTCPATPCLPPSSLFCRRQHRLSTTATPPSTQHTVSSSRVQSTPKLASPSLIHTFTRSSLPDNNASSITCTAPATGYGRGSLKRHTSGSRGGKKRSRRGRCSANGGKQGRGRRMTRKLGKSQLACSGCRTTSPVRFIFFFKSFGPC